MAQYWYHTEATIKYMEKYLDEIHCYKDAISQLSVSKSTQIVLEALKQHLPLDKQEGL